MSYLLEHLRVIDAASFLAAPGAATILGDFGADVIKIEPLTGDGYRTLVGSYPIGYHWLLTSRNKRSIALDLARPEGRGVLDDLIKDADVVLTNFIGKQLERFGMDYERLSGINPRLVYAHMTGYGTDGPDVERRAFDSIAWWARSGLMDLVRDRGQTPLMPAPGFGDHSTASALFGAIMTGLYRRERTGKGAYVTTSLLANGVWANGMALQGVVAGVDISARKQAGALGSPFAATYQTADGDYLIFTIINFAREWKPLCQALDREEWLTDERFANREALIENRHTLKDLIREAISKLTTRDVFARLDAHGITYGPVRTMREVIDDPQAAANESVIETGDPGADYPKTFASPIKIKDEPKRPPTRAPDIGAHSVEILKEAGRSDADIQALIDAGVVGVPDRPI